MRRALGIFIASLGAEHPDSRMVQENLNALLADLGKPQES